MSHYFDLGPSDDVRGLCTIHRTAHTVSTDDDLSLGGTSITLSVPKNRDILTYQKKNDGKYEKTTVDKIPDPIARVQQSCSYQIF